MAADIIRGIDDLPYAPSVFVFEDYGPINRTSGKIAQRAELCGIIKHCAFMLRKVPIVTLTPPALKQFATGKGNANKEQMLQAAAQCGYYPDTHDEADAFFAARLGAALYDSVPVTVDYTVSKP